MAAGAPFLLDALRALLQRRLVWQSAAVLAAVAGIAAGAPLAAALVVCAGWLVQLLRRPPAVAG